MMIRHVLSDHRPHWLAEIDEYYTGFLLAHLRFWHFNQTTYRQFLKEWHESIHALRKPLFALNEENGGDTWVKFVTKLGFKRTAILAHNGEPYYVFTVQPNEH